MEPGALIQASRGYQRATACSTRSDAEGQQRTQHGRMLGEPGDEDGSHTEGAVGQDRVGIGVPPAWPKSRR
jgi:hypothetical protein